MVVTAGTTTEGRVSFGLEKCDGPECSGKTAARSESQCVFGITVTSRLRHADLWRACKQLGSQSALARHLKVSNVTVNSWVNLRNYPSASMPEDVRHDIEAKLFALTGKLLDELFPEAFKCAKAFLSADKTVERTAQVDTDALLTYAEHTRRRLTVDEPECSDVQELVADAMRFVSTQERAIIIARFGLEGASSMTLKEAGAHFGLTQERIRQVEHKAIRKIRRRAGGRLAQFAGWKAEYECFACGVCFGQDKRLLKHILETHLDEVAHLSSSPAPLWFASLEPVGIGWLHK